MKRAESERKREGGKTKRRERRNLFTTSTGTLPTSSMYIYIDSLLFFKIEMARSSVKQLGEFFNRKKR